MTEPNLRELTTEILYEILEQDGYTHLVLGAALEKYQYFTKQQRAFITRVTQGTVERLIQIDAVINRFSQKTKVKKMKPYIRTILRSGVYQIVFMDGVLDAAVCDESVKQAKKKGYAGLSGFVNAMLRNISRNKETLSFSGLSETYAMPQWIVDLWQETYDTAQLEEILKALLTEKKTCIRIQTDRITKEELKQRLEKQSITVEECGEIPYALYISDYDYLKAIPEFSEGLFYVQDFSSMMAVYAAGVQKNSYIIDVCAAPGGKSLHAAELMQKTGMVEARDVSDYKVALLCQNIQKSGMQNIRAVKKDATIYYEADEETADIVLCDAPCSGLGVIAGKPDIKYRMTRQKQLELVKLQRSILSTVCRYVKKGGVLLYSTCTVCKDENEDNVAWFLKEFPEFSLLEMKQILPVAGRQDGFFYAKIMREK